MGEEESAIAATCENKKMKNIGNWHNFMNLEFSTAFK